VTVSGTPATVTSSNQFTGSAQLGTGTQTFTVVATDASGNTRTNTYQVTVSGTGETFVYDANGNLCAKGGTTCTNGTTIYEWDAENRLVDVKQGSTTLASFVYNGKGRRAQKTAGGVTHSYVYDRQNIIEERLSSGQTYDYVQSLGTDRPLAQRDQAGTVSYYLADHLGSIVQMTSSAGSVTLTREYDPWGNLLQGNSAAGFAFSGREWDPEVGMYYYRARFYDPSTGRFVSEDPAGIAGGLNLFEYAANSPATRVDPYGLAPSAPDPDWCAECVRGCLLRPKVILGCAALYVTCTLVCRANVPCLVICIAAVTVTCYVATKGCIKKCEPYCEPSPPPPSPTPSPGTQKGC
jgi:RHS repeat-associated protein